MAIDKDVFSKYLGALAKSTPQKILYSALVLFLIGIIFFIKGKRSYKERTAYLFLIEYYALLLCSTVIYRKPKQ